MNPTLSISRRTRSTPFTSRVVACGVKAYTVYNHTLLPTVFRDIEADYWHLCEHVQVWDVSCERQVEIKGTDAQRLVQLMTPRDLSKTRHGQCFYMPLCDSRGMILNDPVAIKHHDNHWWLSIGDSDIMLWALGLATGFGLQVDICEPDVWPLAVQGPKAEELMARVFGDCIREIRFFGYKAFHYGGKDMLVARSGWSKQGGFEIYVNDAKLGGQLWDELFEKGYDLNVGPGCPNLIERIESGLLSFGNDMGYDTTPLECGLEKYVSMDADIDSLSIAALRQHSPTQRLMGLLSRQQLNLTDYQLYAGEQRVGEIRSNTWSPRYQAHLGFVLCNLAALQSQAELHVKTSAGPVAVQLGELPYDFNQLGLAL
jgi:dimethylsulfoniopropionate demethylase